MLKSLNSLIGENIAIDFVGCFGYSINFGGVIDVTYDEESVYLLNDKFSEFEICTSNVKKINLTCMGCSIEYENMFLSLEIV